MKSCTICETAEGEAAGTEGMREWNRANKMSNFWSKAETCCLRVENIVLEFVHAIVELVHAIFEDCDGRRRFGHSFWKEYFTIQRAVRRRQDIDRISNKKVVLVKRNLLFQKGSMDFRRRSRCFGR